MKKLLSFLLLARVCLTSVFAGESCEKITKDTACEYSDVLTLVSSPNQITVNEDNCDSERAKSDWKQRPTVSYPNANPNKFYTLLCIDPDAPGYKKGQYYLHWLVSNIKGEHFAKGDLGNANHLTEYYGPNPPAGSGAHRYMFVAFEQNEADGTAVENPKTRSKFELNSWLEKSPKLCGPQAGIQFRTQF